MTLKFDLSVLGDERVRDDLEKMAERARDPKPVFNRIADLLHAGVGRQFDSQGAYAGKRWPALSSETARQGPALTMLRDTFTVRRIAKTKVTIGSRHPLVRIHQGGAEDGRRGDLPARPMAVVGKSTTRQATAILTDFLVG